MIFDVAYEANKKHVPAVRWIQAEVDGFSGGILDLVIEGEVVEDIPYLDSYTPTVGDTVEILSQGSRVLVIGAIA